MNKRDCSTLIPHLVHTPENDLHKKGLFCYFL